MKIDRQQIVATALDVLNDVGIDRLTTRLIADRLGVQQPALYWHFKNKRMLLDAMNGEILTRGHRDRTPRSGEPWQTFIRRNAHSFRSALLAYRDAARVHAGTEGDPEDVDHFEAQLTFLVAAGMKVESALKLQIAIGRYIVGCVMEQQAELASPPDKDSLDRAVKGHPLLSIAIAAYRDGGHEELFEAGLDLLIAGAEAKLLVSS
ncbi:MAG: TetR/AcrR family transcriptional regulator C-terminal domain-containing protein [Pseudomonadota bacterium]|uniref:TetR/AcrR family transcriptional regulator C-terminal domain-containing protein n=1 Tax=Sphingomonas sp. ERG5 TaxID=1381597 RepID=UPI00054B5A68|nr:TetR/AcrR family transcriptional regulator C-terminal domain-containing protein [Sphingomonas sp. ERG5]